MDVEEGGRVDEIFVEAGQQVEKGDLILRISNAALQRSAIAAETALLENLDRLSTTKFQRAQSKLTLRENLLNIDFEILELQKKYDRFSILQEQGSVLSKEEFETLADSLEFLKQRRQLLYERIEQEDLLNEQQLAQTNKSIERLNLSLDLLTQIKDSLNVRAPISGHVSSIDAELGQNLSTGRRIGRVDVLDIFKLRAEIDQYYLSDIDIGTTGHLTLNQLEYQVSTTKIYPEVTDDQFAIDMAFIDTPPEGLRRGQRLTVKLSFSEPKQSLMVEKGGFYQQTGGRWVYLISEDGRSATRTNLRLGRQNPRYVEILGGLAAGDRIVTSGYDAFNESDELVFAKPL
jgi:HlyD family secretion protein